MLRLARGTGAFQVLDGGAANGLDVQGEVDVADAKVVQITGEARGLGRAMALGAARDGHDVVVNYRTSAEVADELCQDIVRSGRHAVAVQADVGQAEAAASLAARHGGGRLRPPGLVINNAGVGEVIALDALDEAAFTRTLRTNLLSAFPVSQAVPHMRARRPAGVPVFGRRAHARRHLRRLRRLQSRGEGADAVSPAVDETSVRSLRGDRDG